MTAKIPKKAAETDAAGRNEKLAAARRLQYVKNKGIYASQPVQLDLLFPKIADRLDLRHMPNDIVRTSIFTANNKNIPRKALVREKLFSYNSSVTVLFSGVELRAYDDELVWLELMKYGQSVPFGEPIKFHIKDMVQGIDWKMNGQSYNRVRECLSRLKATEVLVSNDTAYGVTKSFSLINKYGSVNDTEGSPTHYSMFIDKEFLALYAGNTFTSHKWAAYRKLSPAGRKLADYADSHRVPFPLSLEKFALACDWKGKHAAGLRRQAKAACAELVEAGIVSFALLKDDQLLFVVPKEDREQPDK